MLFATEEERSRVWRDQYMFKSRGYRRPVSMLDVLCTEWELISPSWCLHLLGPLRASYRSSYHKTPVGSRKLHTDLMIYINPFAMTLIT